MRALLLVPFAVLVTAACGFAGANAFGLAIHEREMMIAGITCLVAGALASLPIILTRGASQIAVVQAALLGTIVHLFVCIITATVLALAKLVAPQPYLYWILGFYWMTLMALVIGFARAVRSAPPGVAQPHQK